MTTKHIPSSPSSLKNYNYRLFYIFSLVVVGYILYYPAQKNDFVNWDDDVYILENQDITSLSNLDKFFSNYYIGHYHPLTMVSYALDYKFDQYNPRIYHLHNILLHLLTTIIIFFLAYLLLNSYFSSFLLALLFMIHPLRVESVAWIAERKDVLYAFHYFVAIWCYVIAKKTIQIRKKRIYLGLTYLFFILSLLSKTAAVSLPLILIIIDIYLGSPVKKAVVKKIPLLLISIAVGIFTVYVLGHEKAIYSLGTEYTTIDRVFMTFYALSFYIVRLFYPFDLSVSYFFVEKTNGFLPLIYYLSPLFIAGIVFLIIRIKVLKKELVFGFLVYFLSIFMFLQIIPSGRVLVADRYAYVPYFGLFFIIAALYNYLKKYKKSVLVYYWAIIITLIAGSFYSTFKRIKVWKNGVSLFTDLIENYPDVALGYVNRGMAYFYGFSDDHHKDYYAAIKDFSKAIEMDSTNVKAIFNRGNSLYMINDFNNALNDFNRTIKLDSAYPKAYNNRGLVYSRLMMDNKSLEDYNMAIKLKPDFSDAFFNRGITYYNTGQLNKACKDWKQAKLLKYPDADKFLSKYCN